MKIKKTLFLNPPDPALVKDAPDLGYAYFEPPLGLLYVYSYLKNKKKYDTYFVDLNIEMKFISRLNLYQSLKYLIDFYKPDMVAISALYYSSINTFHIIAKKIKEINPKIIVVLGGHYPTHITDMALADKNVDYVVISEGELGLAALIDGLNTSSNLENIEGIAFIKNGKLIKNDRKIFWSGFENSKRLPWEDVQVDYYFKEGRHFLYRVYSKDEIRLGAVTATRGCPNQCTFCSSHRFFKRRWRCRKVDLIIDEIKFLKDNCSVNTIVFNDENMTVNKNWLLNLLDELKKLNIKWIAGAGLAVRMINDEELIKKMYESGIALFTLAIESSNDETLKKIKKPLSIDEAKNVIRLIRKYGNGFILGFFITGFPFETKKDILDTLEFAGKLDLDWRSYYCFQPLPGTELHDYCIDNNLMDGYDSSNYTELHYAAEIKYIDYTSKELDKLNYKSNIKYNFLKNRNLLLGTNESLKQAERDFNYVLDIVPNHVFAYLGLAEIEKKRNNLNKRKEYLQKAKNILLNDKSFDWSFYVSMFGIDIDKLLLGTDNNER